MQCTCYTKIYMTAKFVDTSFASQFKKKNQNYLLGDIRSKILFSKNLSNFVETVAYFYQVLYSKNAKV